MTGDLIARAPDLRRRYMDAAYAALDAEDIPKGVLVELEPEPAEGNQFWSEHPIVRLGHIEVPRRRRRQGLGSKTMQVLTRLADRMGVALALRAATGRNETFHERFGFEGSGRMLRPPGAPVEGGA